MSRAYPSEHDACPPPPSKPTVEARALHRACLILGSLRKLAIYLDVEEAPLLRWIDGEEEPPKDALLSAVNIVLLYADDIGGRS